MLTLLEADVAPLLTQTEPPGDTPISECLSQPLDLTNLPADLQAGPLFCAWKKVPNPKKPGTYKKKPINVLTGKAARTNYPQNFADLSQAIYAVSMHAYDGVGRLMQHSVDGIYAIDVDHCVSDGQLNEYARDLMARGNTYAEITPSQDGIRIYVRAAVPPALTGRCSVKVWNQGSHPDYPELEVQLFLDGQYVTLTGQQIEGTPNDLTYDPAFLDYLLHQNPAKQQEYYPAEAPAGRAPAPTQRSLPTTSPSTPERPDTEPVNCRKINARIKTMILRNEIFRRNWNRRAEKPGKTNSEYQYHLVTCAYFSYQLTRSEITYLLQRWCQLHGVIFRPHRLDSWLRNAHLAFEASDRMTYKQWETERKRQYRTRKRVAPNTTPPPTPVEVRDNHVDYPARQQRNRLKQVLELRAQGKSQTEIAKLLGVRRSTVANHLSRHRRTTPTVSPESKVTGQEHETPAPALPPQNRQEVVPLFNSPLAELLYELCREHKFPMRWKTANAVIRQVTAYAVELGYEELVTETLIQSAVRQAPEQTGKGYVKFLKELLAESACQEDFVLFELCDLIVDRGLPTRHCIRTGPCCVPSAALRQPRCTPNGHCQVCVADSCPLVLSRMLRPSGAMPSSIEDCRQVLSGSGRSRNSCGMNWTSRIVLPQ